MISEIIAYFKRRFYPTDYLVKMGLKVGKNFIRQGGCIIDECHCWLISIGDNVTLAPGVRILAHDASTKRQLGYTKIGLVCIGNNVFIGANSVILPNVNIGDNVIIGAGAVVTRDIPQDSVAVGNPAKVISNTNEHLKKHKDLLENRPVFDKRWTVKFNISDSQKKEMVEKLKDGIGYVE